MGKETNNTKKEMYDINSEPTEELGIGIRHFQALLMFLCILTAYCIRASMSIAIVAMTHHTSVNDDIMIFPWDKKVQNLILSSFFLGYSMLQFPAGVLATKFGGKILLVVALGTNGLMNLFLPWAVQMAGWKALLTIRILQGLTQGCIFPSMNTLLGKWAPLNERSRMSNYVYAGAPLGAVIAMPISGFLSASSLGWPAIFYLFGTVGTIVSAILMYCSADSPRLHKFISEAEREYIESSLGNYVEKVDPGLKRNMKTPWKAIFTSVPLCAICISHIGNGYGFLTLFLETPTYLKEVHGIDMKNSGLLTSVPYIAMWLVQLSGSFLADYIVNKGIMTLTNVRKSANTFGNVCPAIALLIICMVPTDQTTIIVCLIIFAIGCMGASNCGALINHIDLSPNFAGIMFGLTNMMTNIFGLIAPNIVGFIVTDSKDPSDWNYVFYIASGVYFVTNLFYLAFASSEKQQWDEPIYDEIQKHESYKKV